MKIVQQIPSYLLAAVFIIFGMMFFLKMMPEQPEMNDLQKSFFGAVGTTGYMNVIKVLEIVGGVLLLFKRTRGIGICIIVPIVVNIFLYEIFIAKQPGIGIGLLLISILAVYFDKDKFSRILNG